MKKALLSTAVLLLLLFPAPALAHCDTLDGPVVADARRALDAGDVTPALKWIAPAHEAEFRGAFARALAVRGLGAEAQALADRFFFETLVRIHREGEGAPYTGLKAPGTPVEAGIAAADTALESGSADELVRHVTHAVEAGLRARHARVVETRKRAGETVIHGREFVAAYVQFIHYAEGLVQAAAGPAGHAAQHAAAAADGAPRETAPPAHIH